MSTVMLHTRKRRRALSLEELFWRHVDKSGECWVWTGGKCRGYGSFTHTDLITLIKTTYRAHRLAYELLVGPIPEELTLDHECENTACVRPGPKHCVPRTRGENALRGNGPAALNKRKTHCDNGHILEGNNIVSRPARPNTRECRTCANAGKRRRWVSTEIKE